MELVDARLRRVLRGCGLAMVVGAALPWLVNLSAGSALADLPPAATDHPLLAGHWTGVSDTSSGVSTGSCDFTAITRTHSGIGWHFVLPGIPANLSSFSATFADAGTITVTTTETAAGVVVQRGKGAVIFTPGHDTLVATGIWHDANGDHAGQGVNNRPNGHYMQLSNVCGGTPTSAGSPPPPTGAPTPTTGPTPTHTPRPTVTPSVGPTGSGTPGPTGTPTGTPSPTGSPTPTGSTTPTGTPSATPSSTGSPTPTTSVVPTQTVSPTPTTSVLHTKIISPTPSPAPRRVPFTGFPARIGFALSLGLVGVGALLLLAPGRVIAAAVGRHHRR